MISHARIDLLNIGLIGLSLMLALLFPFELFLVAYAVLGPLHYLTEINWIRNKSFFVKERSWVWIASILALGITIPFLTRFPQVNWGGFTGFVHWLAEWGNSGVFLALVMATGFLFLRKRKHLLILAILGLFFAFILNRNPLYGVILGTMMPTVIHVYFFTMLFMLNGALRSNSKVGILAALLPLLCPVVILLVDVNWFQHQIPAIAETIFLTNDLQFLNTNIAEAIGISDGTPFGFSTTVHLKVQAFISFAYLYHYLNWFSKTTVIGWHKALTNKNSLIIGGLWLSSIALFAYDYKVGFIGLIFLSLLHVFLEFPVNVLSVRGIVDWVRMQMPGSK